MTFSYKSYWNTTLILPSLVILLMIVLVISSSYVYWVKEASKQQMVNRMLGYIFIICVAVFCIVPQFKYLLNGGIYLLSEKEQDALVHKGVIESINEPSNRFPGFKLSHEYGADIMIDGVQFFSVTSGDYEEGDSVIVYYLPHSHFVLAIEESGIQMPGL